MRTIQAVGTNEDHGEAVRILAGTLYRELVRNGFSRANLVDLSKELLGHVEHDVRKACSPDPLPGKFTFPGESCG